MSKTDLKSLNQEELQELVCALGEKPYRGRQIYTWLHQRLVTSFDEMTDLSRKLRERLADIGYGAGI